MGSFFCRPKGIVVGSVALASNPTHSLSMQAIRSFMLGICSVKADFLTYTVREVGAALSEATEEHRR
jgi:hypothetical protein